MGRAPADDLNKAQAFGHLSLLLSIASSVNTAPSFEKLTEMHPLKWPPDSYYIEQINSKDIVELLNISDDTIVNSIKERMLPKLIFCEKYPQGNEYEKLILESAKDLGVV